MMLTEIGRFIWPLSMLFNADVRSAGYGAQAFGVFTEEKNRFAAIGRGEVAMSAPDRSTSRTV